jgi:hypothetical protein
VLRCVQPPTDRTLRVRVTDADGVPVLGALVDWLGAEGLRTVETGADGVALCDGMLAAKTRISCRMPPSRPHPEGQLAPASVELVPEGQLVEMPFRRGVPFTVVVRDPSGAGLAGAKIRLGAPAKACWPVAGTTELDGSCTVTVEAGLEIEEVSVRWQAAADRVVEATRRWVDTESGELVIVLDSSR